MKASLPILILMIIGTYRAQNLVPNGGFEQFTSCPDFHSQLNRTSNWIQASQGSPDYFNQCSSPNNNLSFNVPATLFGYQPAHGGVAYTGLFISTLSHVANGREYIEVQLLSPLKANTCYRFEMYVALADMLVYSAHNIGVYFSNALVTYTNTYTNLPLTPQVNNVPGNLPDSMNWTLVSGNYVAAGGESYIIIGNFMDDAHTDTVKVNSLPFDRNAYVYIDDVSLKVCVTTNIEEQTEQSFVLFPSPVSDELHIEIQANEPAELTLYSPVSGKILQHSFANSAILAVGQLPQGIYLYEVRNKSGVIKSGKIIKQ